MCNKSKDRPPLFVWNIVFFYSFFPLYNIFPFRRRHCSRIKCFYVYYYTRHISQSSPKTIARLAAASFENRHRPTVTTVAPLLHICVRLDMGGEMGSYIMSSSDGLGFRCYYYFYHYYLLSLLVY